VEDLLREFLRYRCASFACLNIYRAALRAGLGCRRTVHKYSERNTMSTQYLMPMIRNVNTGETQMVRELGGAKYLQSQSKLCLSVAEQYAHKLSQRTGDNWVAFTRLYTPTGR